MTTLEPRSAQNKKPFVSTHSRIKDGLAAMVLGSQNGTVLYRVQWFDNGKRHENTLRRPASVFEQLFKSLHPTEKRKVEQ